MNTAARWGAFFLELLMLLMLYSAALLAPVPFGFARIGIIVSLVAASFVFAYVASMPQSSASQTRHFPIKRAIFRWPSLLWMVAIGVIGLQLVGSLLMVYLANRK